MLDSHILDSHILDSHILDSHIRNKINHLTYFYIINKMI